MRHVRTTAGDATRAHSRESEVSGVLVSAEAPNVSSYYIAVCRAVTVGVRRPLWSARGESRGATRVNAKPAEGEDEGEKTEGAGAEREREDGVKLPPCFD